MSIKREDLNEAWVQRITAEMASRGNFQPRSPEEREASLQLALGQLGPGEDAWLFGYGSLMWNPTVRYSECRDGLIYGFHRAYCFWTEGGRGSPECPGMMLALDRGGSCRGMAFRIPAAEAEAELRLIWMREMLSGVYQARWVNVHTKRGPVRAVTFVINREHPLYARDVPLPVQARHIARAAGWIGSCREYLDNTIAHLDALGVRDSSLHRLQTLVHREDCSKPLAG
jgi:cation transport protein ChaC